MPTLPLTDAAWDALRPHLPAAAPGRPIANPRARFDALFAAVTSGQRWTHFSHPHAPTDTLHRHFRRLARAGLWSRLLTLVAARKCPKALKPYAAAIQAAHRRTIRILGLKAIVHARRLGQGAALPAPAWLLPDPDLSETCFGLLLKLLKDRTQPHWAELLRRTKALLRVAGGRSRIHHSLRTL